MACALAVFPLMSQEVDPPVPADGEGVLLTVHVVDAATSSPIPNVSIQLNRSTFENVYALEDERRWSYSFTTDENGIGTVENTVPSVYLTNTTEELYGFARGPERSIEVKPGEAEIDYTVRMWKASTLEGTILDQNGLPLPGVAVELMEVTWLAGMRNAATITPPLRTDDDGAFHFSGVLPGDYFLYATEAIPLTERYEEVRNGIRSWTYPHADTFYPDSVSIDGAVPITVFPGVNQGGFRLTMPESRYFQVSGRVLGIPEGAENVEVVLDRLAGPGDAPRLFTWPALRGFTLASAESNGSFVIEDVPPGYYVADIRSRGVRIRGRQTIEVFDGNVEDMRIPVLPSWTFGGRVQYDDGTPAGPFSLSLRSYRVGSGTSSALTKADDQGGFSWSGLEAGTYRMMLPFNRDLIIKSVAAGGRVFEGGVIELAAPGSDDITVTVSATGASIAGSVDLLEPNVSSPGGVTLNVEPLTPRDAEYIEEALLDTQGGFRFPLLEAGTYRLCAWNDEGNIVNKVLNSPRFGGRLQRACEVVELGAESVKQVRLEQLDAAAFR